METIYFDTCALNRLSDSTEQLRVRRESDAVIRVLELVGERRLRWVASTVLRYEVLRNTDLVRRMDTLEVMNGAADIIEPTAFTLASAAEYTARGLSKLDALHLAISQQAGADWLLTTDDRFLKAGNRARQNRAPELVNPVDWLQRRHLWLLQHPSSNPE